MLNEMIHDLSRIVNRWEAPEWAMVGFVVLGVGMIMMRGFGSRKNY